MTPPPGAILEAVIQHPSGQAVALYDVSHLLPTKKGRPQPARPTGAKIRRFYRPRIAPDFPGGPLGEGD